MEIRVAADGPVPFDVSCFGLDGGGKLSDDRYLIFYNQKRSPGGEIEALGPQGEDSMVFRVDLDELLPAVRRLAFTLTVDLESEGTMALMSRGYLRLIADGEEVARYPFAGADFGEERSLIVAEIYHRDVWRFAAVGQGFKDDLRALLKHYGGEEAQEAPPPPTKPSPPPATPIHVEGRGELQDAINVAPPGTTITLGRDEFEGPIVVNRPLVLEGKGAVIWARKGPVVTVSAGGVTLRDVAVEVTVPGGQGEADVALKLADGVPRVAMDGVRVRGRVLGLGEEGGGAWRLPDTLDLGTFAPRGESRFVVGVRVPVACRLASGVSGLAIQPDSLTPGEHDVVLSVRDVPTETLIHGFIEVRSTAADVARTIAVTGGTVNARGIPPTPDRRLWPRPA